MSALDADVKKKVYYHVFEGILKNKTRVLVTHAVDFLHLADKIVVMDKGQIVDTGTHDALVAKEGLYAHLARLQFTDGAVEA